MRSKYICKNKVGVMILQAGSVIYIKLPKNGYLILEKYKTDTENFKIRDCHFQITQAEYIVKHGIRTCEIFS